MNSKHDALRAEWELLGKPDMDYRRADLGDLSAWIMLPKQPSWSDDFDYRFAGDPHHALRLEWLQSGKTLIIEVDGVTSNGGWRRIACPGWKINSQYRKAEILPGMHIEEGARPTPYIPTYEPLELHPLNLAFDDAIHQCTKGKGRRHGGESVPFLEQPWYAIAKRTGVGGLVFQGIKKAGEAMDKDEQEEFEREILGAIAYLGMAYLFTKTHGFKKPNNESN
jgi:hypothetical protein